MRVTSEMMVSSTLRRLETRLERYERAQSRLATGRSILRPSDDPSGTRQALALRSEMQSRGQELRTIGDATSWLDHTDSELMSALTRVHRVRDLTVRGASNQSQTAMDAIAIEVDQIREELEAVANTTHAGRPLFAGSGGEIDRRVNGQEDVQVNVLADDAFGSDGELFDTLREIAEALREGESAEVGGLIGAVDEAEKRLTTALATVGANRNRVESAEARVKERQLVLRGQLAQVEDVDVADAIMDLQVEEVAYQATLGALAKALPPSLVSFLA